MKIGCISYYAVSNIGDRILTDVVAWKLKKNGHKVKIIDIQARYAYRFNSLFGKIEKIIVSRFFQNDTVDKKRHYFQSLIAKCDVIFFAGGQIISLGSNDCIENIEMIINICNEMKKDVYFNAIGFSTWGKENNQRRLKQIFANKIIKEISVRDDAEEFNENILKGNMVQARQVCDTAVWSCEAYGICRKIKKNGKKNRFKYHLF